MTWQFCMTSSKMGAGTHLRLDHVSVHQLVDLELTRVLKHPLARTCSAHGHAAALSNYPSAQVPKCPSARVPNPPIQWAAYCHLRSQLPHPRAQHPGAAVVRSRGPIATVPPVLRCPLAIGQAYSHTARPGCGWRPTRLAPFEFASGSRTIALWGSQATDGPGPPALKPR